MRTAGNSTTSLTIRRRPTTSPARNRAKLIEMIALWYVEAGKYNVLPLDSRGTARFADERPQLSKDRTDLRLLSGHADGSGERRRQGTQSRAQPDRRSRGSEGGAQGVLVCHGSNAGGYSLFVKDNKLHYVHNYVGAQEFHVESGETVPEGKATLRYEFEPTGKPDIAHGKGTPGRARLFVNGKQVGQADFPVTVPLLLGLGGGLTVGRNPGLVGIEALRTALRLHRNDLQGDRGCVGTKSSGPGCRAGCGSAACADAAVKPQGRVRPSAVHGRDVRS